ncbi:MAG: hypothetical protein FJ189_01805 [Gammaproteobacteria bacterium]|nr:hypothetical protein [Chloroflexota bacterium]MBM4200006.1 hypothetical protein [Gammaproteobacteria bacterium]
MNLRCKDGDLALVIHDEPDCEANIGRMVEVRGPVNFNPRLELPCWLVKPVTSEPYLVKETTEVVVGEVVGWASRVEHPDAWLLPLRPPEQETLEGVYEQEPELVVVR